MQQRSSSQAEEPVRLKGDLHSSSFIGSGAVYSRGHELDAEPKLNGLRGLCRHGKRRHAQSRCRRVFVCRQCAGCCEQKVRLRSLSKELAA